MTKLSDMAKAYVPQTTKNLAELDKVPVDVEVTEEEHTREEDDGSKTTFKVKVCVINKEKYRVPNSVLEGIKGILGKMPDTKYVSFLKSGTGMNTRYQVIPVN